MRLLHRTPRPSRPARASRVPVLPALAALSLGWAALVPGAGSAPASEPASEPVRGPAAGGIEWTPVYEDALARAKDEGMVIFVAVNMDGERANDRLAEEVYQEKDLVKLSERTVNLVASAFDHGSGTCKRFGHLTCEQHRKVDIRVREHVLTPDEAGYVVAPQHAWLAPDGTILLSVPYEVDAAELEWCFVTALKKVDPDSDVRMSAGARPPKRLVMDGFAPPDESAGGPSPATREEVLELIKEVNKGTHPERGAAVRRILTADEPEALDFTIKQLRAGGGKRGGDPWERQARVLSDIALLSPQRYWEIPEEFASSSNDLVREQVAACLEQLQAPDSLKAIQTALRKEKVERLEGAWLRAMASVAPSDKKVHSTLVKAATREKDAGLRCQALVGCGYLTPDEDRDAALREAFAADAPELREAAALGMALTRDEAWLEVLRPVQAELPDGQLKEGLGAAVRVLEGGGLEPLCGPLMRVCGDGFARERFFGPAPTER